MLLSVEEVDYMEFMGFIHSVESFALYILLTYQLSQFFNKIKLNLNIKMN